MEKGVLIYQVGIFAIIYISSFFGRKARNRVVLILSIATLINVYMLWLLVIQYLNIFIAYTVTEKKLKSNI